MGVSRAVWSGFRRVLVAGFAVVVLSGSGAGGTEVTGGERVGGWRVVGEGSTGGASGVAAIGRGAVLVVRDNKERGENRIAEITRRAGVRPLTWKGSAPPVDLEALAAVPGKAGEYVAVASRGLGYHLKVRGRTAMVHDLFPLPAIGPDPDFEGFALVTRAGRTAAVWADRGEGTARPATLHAALMSFNAYGEAEFGRVTSRTFRAVHPRGDVRHATDLAVTRGGRLLVSAAADEGDDGPFRSGVHDAGRFTLGHDGTPRLELSEHPRLLAYARRHKIEALDCLPGSDRAVLGTDDENLGGALTTARLCAR